MESSDISQESASTVSCGREFGYGRRSQQQFCRCVVECGAARDRGRLCRILAFARAESRTIDGNGRRLFTREFSFGTRAEFGFCGRRIQRNRNVRYFSGCECRKCSSSQESSVSEKESSDIFSGIGINGFCSEQFCRECRLSQEQSQKRSRRRRELSAQEQSSLNTNVRYFSGRRKCFELFRKRKAYFSNRHHGFCGKFNIQTMRMDFLT
jgi:hypothetical protein